MQGAQEEWVHFVHGTTRELWIGDTIDPTRGGGDFGAGFYVVEDTAWGRHAATNWARRKARGGGEPILVRVRMRRAVFEVLDRQDVPDDTFGEIHRHYARFGLTGKELLVGAVGRRGLHGGRAPDHRLPLQYKFEGSGIATLVIDQIIRVG